MKMHTIEVKIIIFIKTKDLLIQLEAKDTEVIKKHAKRNLEIIKNVQQCVNFIIIFFKFFIFYLSYII